MKRWFGVWAIIVILRLMVFWRDCTVEKMDKNERIYLDSVFLEHNSKNLVRIGRWMERGGR